MPHFPALHWLVLLAVCAGISWHWLNGSRP